MADDAPSEETPVTFNIKSSSDAKYVLTLPLSMTVNDLKSKLSTSEYADIPPERQRLIYSGRVLKDPDTLGSHKIKDGHTIHLVKGADSNQRQNPSSSGTTSSTAGSSTGAPAATGVPSNIAAGTGNNPLAGLTGARYAGFTQLPSADMFGADGGMGPPPDPEQMASMLDNPQFASTLNEALQNPQVLDMMVQQNPMLRDNPMARQMLESPEFRRMLTDPQALRSMMQMQRAMGMGGMGSMMGGQGGSQGDAFPAPGVTDTTEAGTTTTTTTPRQPDSTPSTGQQPAFNPMAMFGGANPAAGGAGANPFAALFNNPALGGAQGGQGQTGATQEGQQQPPPNPFAAMLGPGGAAGQASPSADRSQQQQPANPFTALMQNPALMQQAMAAMGGGGGANPFANLFGGMGGEGAGAGAGAPATGPPDTRPPEERYEGQLRQLNDMGFYEFERNVEALRRTGGSVQGAVEYLLTH